MNHQELGDLSAVEAVALITAKEVSPVELTEAVLERIDRYDGRPECVLHRYGRRGRGARRAAGPRKPSRETSPSGLCTASPSRSRTLSTSGDSRTTFGSKLFEHNVTAEDAPVIQRLRRAGAVIIGRTNTPEFGWKGVTENRVFGATRNPWNLDRTPGGSSGGASAAVAAGMGPVGIGTDGGGSIRIPASFSGLVGHKPSFGRVPNYPATAVDSLRHTGALTRTVGDAALALAVLAGPDERDPGSLPADATNYVADLDRGIEGLRIAYSPDLGYARVEAEVAEICERTALRLGEAGASVERIELDWDDPYECWRVFFYGGIAAFLADRLPDEGDLLDPGLREIVDAGLSLTAGDYVAAGFQRNTFWQRVRVVFETYDLLVTPALAVRPFPIGQNNADPLPGQQPRALNWTAFTYPFNLTGQPAASVPAGWTADDLPVGLQIVGPRFADGPVLRAARAVEQIQPWSHRRPALEA